MKVKDHDPLLGNIQDSVHQGCNLNVSLRKKVSVVFYNLQNYDSHLISQEIGRNNFKINVIPKTTEKYMSFTIQQSKEKGNKPGLLLVFIDSVHFLNNSLDNLVKKLGENDFYHLSQGFNTNVLDIIKPKKAGGGGRAHFDPPFPRFLQKCVFQRKGEALVFSDF